MTKIDGLLLVWIKKQEHWLSFTLLYPLTKMQLP